MRAAGAAVVPLDSKPEGRSLIEIQFDFAPSFTIAGRLPSERIRTLTFFRSSSAGVGAVAECAATTGFRHSKLGLRWIIAERSAVVAQRRDGECGAA